MDMSHIPGDSTNPRVDAQVNRRATARLTATDLTDSVGCQPMAQLTDIRHISVVRNSVRGLPAIPTGPKIAQPPNNARDFWIPQVTDEGQIYYANTLTGKLSRDLPKDTDDDGPGGDLVGLTASQSSSRSGTSASLGFASANRSNVDLGLDVPRPADSPDPIRGIDPFTAPPIVQDTPIAALPVKPLPLPGVYGARPRANTGLPSIPEPNRLPSFPLDSIVGRNRSQSISDHEHSSEHQRNFVPERRLFPSTSEHRFPVTHITSRLNSLPDIPEPHPTLSVQPSLSPQPSASTSLSMSPSIQQSTSIQTSLSPPTPELISELLQRAQQRIHSVILHLQQFGVPQAADDEDIVDNLINVAITAIRDLLYVAGPPFGQLGGKSKDRSLNNASQTPLVPAQRRAVATLSKFVLSARAVLNDGPWIASDNIGHLTSDAAELERSVIDFVAIAQGVRSRESYGDKASKRLHGYLTASHTAPGKAGAGAAGTWKGFGYVSIEDSEEAPRRNLDVTTFNEFVDCVIQVQERLNAFTEAVRETQPAESITKPSQELLRQISSLLLLLGDIHIARHVDIDPVDQEKLSDGAHYSRTVEKARVLVRSFEATTQAIYDDGAAILVTAQRLRRMELCDSWRGREETYDALEALSTSLDFNIQITRQNLESLLHVGQEQTDILERCNKSPVEWRMSQRSLLAAIFANDDLEANGVHDTTPDPNGILRNVEQGGDSSAPTSPPLPPTPTSGETNDESNEQIPFNASLEDEEAFNSVRTPPRPDKIKAIFGDDVPSHYLISLTAETKPWYLRPNYNSTEVLIDPDGSVRGGTVSALVERLTAHEYADTKFTRAFLMTFKSFTTLDELLNLLVGRFWIQPPPSLNAQELAEWRQYKQGIIRIRVLNTMKSMVQDDDVIDKENVDILDRMAEFASREDVCMIAAAKQLSAAIKRARTKDLRKVTMKSTDPPPPPIVPKKIELLDIDPLELARQLTITESQLYEKIRPSECLQRSKQSKVEYHDGVANFIRRSNRIAYWVTYSILCKDDSRRRAAVMKQFIVIADKCRLIQNFSTMMAIVTGLNSSPIHRLRRSWEQVSSRYMSQLETCEAIINSYKNYNNYRTALAAVAPPCVPFVGVFLTALTHIQDGSKDSLPGNLVNFRKRQKASEVIQDLQRWQTQPHNFHPLPSVLVFINESLNQFGDHDASEMFWQLSLEREPREKDEEKLAKWLVDSGFF